MGNVLFFTKIHNILQMLTLQLTIGCSFGLPSTNFVRQNMYLRTSGRKIVHPITAVLDAKRYWLIKYWLLHDCSGSKEAACSILWFILRIVISQGSSGMRTQPTIDLSIRRCTTSNLCKCFCVSASEDKPNIAVGKAVA